jgi:large subunit ribosomal protein L17
MLSNMATSLILHKRITTTVAKAKALRSYVEPLITKSKDDTTHSRRVAFSYLQSKEAVTELFREIAKKVGDRPGGYTRILKLGNRLGDNADMAMMELVDFNETMLGEATAAKGKTSRRRRGGKKKTAESVAVTPKVAVSVTEEVKEDITEVATEEPKAEVKEEDSKAEAKKEELVVENKVEAKKEKKKAETKEEKNEDNGEETKK